MEGLTARASHTRSGQDPGESDTVMLSPKILSLVMGEWKAQPKTAYIKFPHLKVEYYYLVFYDRLFWGNSISIGLYEKKI